MKTYSDDLPNVSKETAEKTLKESEVTRELTEELLVGQGLIQKAIADSTDEIETTVEYQSLTLKSKINLTNFLIGFNIIMAVANIVLTAFVTYYMLGG